MTKKIKKGQLFINGIINIVFLIFCLCCGFTYAQDKKIIYLETIYIEDPIVVKINDRNDVKEKYNFIIVSKSKFEFIVKNNASLTFKDLLLSNECYYFSPSNTDGKVFLDRHKWFNNVDYKDLDEENLYNKISNTYKHRLFVPFDKSQKKLIGEYEYFDIYPRMFYLFLFKGEFLFNIEFSDEMNNLFFPVVFPHSGEDNISKK